ncbi:unnamed protein product [Cuscuta europaea]|uniref:Zinc finger PHD-type domain-containing protein n=2 Tax=Cuscuta europaea TaxID=41803 RepID=A0A9P1EH89_CUSEU|nr:unnamed protein product [Cuscuta europaea]
MKNRSHGMAMPNQQDDWGDGSWTVDCVCGVNFDDGEEMVNCDDCGVWVHTRCVGYVKSEKVFACDKCKNMNCRNDSEETEVAQLLVELPTKTLNMDNPFNPSLPSSQRPFRLWTGLPMEDKVHVQGIPGGDPALFPAKVSSIFGPQLWKCTGYVPKKFNFQYREFSHWDTEVDDEDNDKKGDVNNQTTADNNGAGVLFSLSKENNFLAPVSNSNAGKSDLKDGKCDISLPSKQIKRLDGSDWLNTNVKKVTNSLHPIVIHHGKRKHTGLKIDKDQGGKKKKKGQVADKGYCKNKGSSIRTACKTLNGEKKMQFYDGRGSKVVHADSNRTSSGSLEVAVPIDHLVEDSQRLDNDYGNRRSTLNSTEHHSKIYPSDGSKHNSSSETLPQEQSENPGVSKIQTSQRETDEKDGIAASFLEFSKSVRLPIKEEDVAVHREASSISAKVELHKSVSIAKANVSDDFGVKSLQNCHDLTGDNNTYCSSVPEINFKADDARGDIDIHCSYSCDATLERTRSSPHHVDTSKVQLFESVKVKADALAVTSQDRSHKAQNVDSSSSILDYNRMKNADGLSRDTFPSNQESTLSEGAERSKYSSGQLKHCSTQRAVDSAAKISATTTSIGSAPSQRKVRVTMGKSSSTLILKPSASESVQKGIPDNNLSNKREDTTINVVEDEEGHEISRVASELPKSSVGSASQHQMSKITYISSSKRKALSDSKDLMPHSSHRSISVRNMSANSGSGESSSSLQSEEASSIQNKPSATNLPQKGEKVNQSGSQPSSLKASGTVMHPPTVTSSTAVLSDEELALLLHQQLNSSPRVPRVPRMRHAGSLPTLTSPAATSMLTKRVSSGGKDHDLSSRKRKDSGKDGSINSQEGADESTKKREGLTPGYKRQDTNHDKRETDSRSSKSVISVKKTTSPSSSAVAGSNDVPSSHEAKELNLSSHKSQRNTICDDDDARVSGRHSPRTLPGLIAEIMSKGERMRYEELCNAVLPHWPHLRKHNGERYAYSSHSQAVLDCLRNRSEWARLVDRGPKGGPKTNTSRKRRNSQSNELDDEIEDGSASKILESQQEEFPKGKRKARKRRRLALRRGRGIKNDVRRRHHRTGVVSDDDDDETSSSPSSNSSDDEITFSEDDEMECTMTSPATKDTSSSSDE